MATSLPCADQRQLVLRGGLGEEVVDAGLRGDGGGGHRVVAGDHHRADAHPAQLRKALLDAALHDVLQIDDAQQPAIAGDSERRAAGFGDLFGDGADLGDGFGLRLRLVGQRRVRPPARHRLRRDRGNHRLDGALADRDAVEIDPAHARLGGERHEAGVEAGHVAGADAIGLLGQHHDRAALRRLVGERRQLGGVGEIRLGHAGDRPERSRLAVAQGDRTGLVEEQRVDVARRLDRAARQGEDVEAHQPVHPGNADGREQRADRRRDQGDEQGNQDDQRDRAAGIGREARDRGHHEHEHDGQPGEQDVQRDLVRSLLARRALDQGDHPIDKGRARRRGDAYTDPVGEHLRTAGHRRAVAAGFPDDGGGFAGDRRLVDRGDTLDDLAVGGDQLASLD
jgi:hypothetical protein